MKTTPSVIGLIGALVLATVAGMPSQEPIPEDSFVQKDVPSLYSQETKLYDEMMQDSVPSLYSQEKELFDKMTQDQAAAHAPRTEQVASSQMVQSEASKASKGARIKIMNMHNDDKLSPFAWSPRRLAHEKALYKGRAWWKHHSVEVVPELRRPIRTQRISRKPRVAYAERGEKKLAQGEVKNWNKGFKATRKRTRRTIKRFKKLRLVPKEVRGKNGRWAAWRAIQRAEKARRLRTKERLDKKAVRQYLGEKKKRAIARARRESSRSAARRFYNSFKGKPKAHENYPRYKRSRSSTRSAVKRRWQKYHRFRKTRRA